MIKRRFFLLLLLFLLISCLVFLVALSYRMGVFNFQDTGKLMPVFPSTETETPVPTPSPTPTATPTPIPEVRIQQGDWKLFTGDYEGAEEEYITVQQNDNDGDIQIASQIGLARIEILNDNPSAAAELLNTIIEENPENQQIARAYFFLAKAYEALNESAGAAAAYTQYLTLNPGPLDGYIQNLIGDMLFDAGDYTGAIAAYQFASVENQPNIDAIDIQTKIGRSYMAMNDYENAIRVFMDIYAITSNDYLKAQMNLLSGQAYLAMGIPEQAYARFQDSVTNFPVAYDTYSGLVALVDAGIPVSDLNRGIVDYYARQYAVGLDALNRHIQNNPDDQDATARYYKALCLQALERYDEAIEEWYAIIREYPEDSFWIDCWEDIAYTQWFYQNNYNKAAETHLEFVRERPTAPEAPGMLFSAARLLETDNHLSEAAAIWERLIVEYPNNELSYRALFMSGICYYRLNEFARSQTIFQRLLVLATTPDEQSAAYLWIGKNQLALNDMEGAVASWTIASQGSPDSYYGIRSTQLLIDESPLQPSQNLDMAVDLASERLEAETWMRSVFSIPEDTDLSMDGSFINQDERMLRGNTFWDLGLYSEAHYEFESIREEYQFDAATNFALLDHFLELGLYRSAILTEWQIMDLANIDESTAFTVPVYFNHIQYGPYFKEIIVPITQEYNFDLLLFYSIIHQESLFEGFVQSSAGARGLMQIMPETGKEIATQTGWPANYQDEDLYRPNVNLRYGANYLARQRGYFDGDLYAALAAYNGGPGNTIKWLEAAPSDPDLFLESIRYTETRTYIMNITEILQTYRKIYQRAQ